MSQEAMEPLVERVAGEVRRALTADGQPDLGRMPLTEMEKRVGTVGGQIVRRALEGLLAEQTHQLSIPEDCPACGCRLQGKQPELKRLKTQHGWVAWEQPVRRCPKCRRDFFPSGEGVGM
jgi:hypothetical protein